MNEKQEALEYVRDTDAGQQPLPEPEAESDIIIRTRLDHYVNAAGKAVSWLVFAAAAISVYEVIMRYAFNSPTSWVHETVVFLIACIFALGGPVALARDKHIRVRLIYDAVSPRARRYLDILNDVITFVFTIAMSYAAYIMFWRASHSPLGGWQLERSGTSWNPPFPALIKGVILLSVAVMMVQAVLHIIHSVRTRPQPRPEGAR